jgi:hypothetical protein
MPGYFAPDRWEPDDLMSSRDVRLPLHRSLCRLARTRNRQAVEGHEGRLVAFGAFVFAMAILLMFSGIPILVMLVIVLLSSGGVMVAYDMNPLIFQMSL